MVRSGPVQGREDRPCPRRLPGHAPADGAGRRARSRRGRGVAEVAAHYGATPTGDADAILGDPGIDAVIIVASPTPTHVDLVTASVRAGKAVLCEKPIDLDLARVDACWADIRDLGATMWSASTAGSIRRSPRCATGSPRGEIGKLEQLIVPAATPRRHADHLPSPPPAGVISGT